MTEYAAGIWVKEREGHGHPRTLAGEMGRDGVYNALPGPLGGRALHQFWARTEASPPTAAHL